MTADVDRPVASDLELLRATADGDGGAFEELVERHQDRVIAVCQRLLGDREEARDAAQEVFLKVYRKAGGFRPDAKISTWLYRIAVNHCLNRLRRRKVVRFLSFGTLSSSDPGDRNPDAGLALVDPVDPGPGADEALATRRRWRATRRALASLPESQRAVIVLAKFEELSYDEIAEVLGTTNSAVASRLFRAMRQLEKALADEGTPGGAPRGSDGSRVS